MLCRQSKASEPINRASVEPWMFFAKVRPYMAEVVEVHKKHGSMLHKRGSPRKCLRGPRNGRSQSTASQTRDRLSPILGQVILDAAPTLGENIA